MLIFKNILTGTKHLFYPHLCTGCGSDILDEDNMLCLHCIDDLPETHFEQHANNPIERIFWGRLPVVAAHSQFYFSKDAVIQRLIHELKYKGNKEIGFYLGRLTANALLNSHRFKNIDIIVPLPLFAEKERKRGYNQAAVIAEGMSAVMNVPVIYNNVTRRRFTQTQTKKHRAERWENVAGSFEVNRPVELKGKNVLLVDDVITTGATLEACGMAILQIANTTLSIATLAHASK
jgi:ComF family protein